MRNELNSGADTHIVCNRLLTEEEIQQFLMRNYSLDQPLICTFLRRSFNDHYLVQSGRQRFVVRIYMNDKYYIKSPADFNFELELLQYLAAIDCPVAYPLRSTKDEMISNFYDGTTNRYCVLFSYAQGTQIETSLSFDLSKLFGETIAKFHLAVDGFSSEFSRYQLDLDYLIIQPLALLSMICEKYNLASLEFFKPYADYLYRAIAVLIADSSNAQSPIWGIIHGDLNPSNIHIDDIEGLTLFDFDHCGYGLRIHDLAVVHLCFDKATYTVFLEAYCGSRLLTQLEKDLIPLYAETLMIRKFMDVLCMMQTTKNSDFDEMAYVIGAVDYLRDLSGG